MTERKNPTRRAEQRVRIDSILNGIRSGTYDDELPQIKAAIEERTLERQSDVLELVREVFGPEASVQVGPVDLNKQPFSPAFPSGELAPEDEPLIPGEEADKEPPPSPTQQGPALIGPDVEIPKGSSGGADSVTAKERQMEAEIESRSPIIGGLPGA